MRREIFWGFPVSTHFARLPMQKSSETLQGEFSWGGDTRHPFITNSATIVSIHESRALLFVMRPRDRLAKGRGEICSQLTLIRIALSEN